MAMETEILKEALDSGLQWGRIRRLTHPKMLPFILTSKGEIQVIDIEKSLKMLNSALQFVAGIIKSGGTVLLVGTQPAAKELVANYGKRLKFPYVADRWLGGTLTNFQTLMARMHHLEMLEKKIASEDFSSYTKKERIKMQREAAELRKKFEGLIGFSNLPNAVFILGAKRHATALREARRRKIPTIVLINTDEDPTLADWPIPGNDNALSAIKFILEKLANAVENTRQNAPKVATQDKE